MAEDPVRRVMAALAPRFPSEAHVEPDLDRIRLLVDVLGSPHKSYPAIAVTGTNGKSSTPGMSAGLLTAFGLGRGRFTSPPPESPTERIPIDGEPISAERF